MLHSMDNGTREVAVKNRSNKDEVEYEAYDQQFGYMILRLARHESQWKTVMFTFTVNLKSTTVYRIVYVINYL